MIRERERPVANGAMMLVLGLLTLIGGTAWLIVSAKSKNGTGVVASLFVMLAAVGVLAGLFTVAPNESRVLQLFGDYVGTVKTPGLRWANPLYTKRKVSVRIRNFESSKLKVNDLDGNPIEIAAVIVWRVVDTAEAVFEVDDYNNYVHVQGEAALRNLAMNYTYDSHDDISESLRGTTAKVADHLKQEIQERLAKAGVEVIEARISHLAYAPEIASAMLQRQQAGAIIAARQRIVEGAVGMVEMALDMLSQKKVVSLDEERKAAMVSNLLVVLCGERGTQPIVNAGTIYQ